MNKRSVTLLEKMGFQVLGDKALGHLRSFPVAIVFSQRTKYFTLQIWLDDRASDFSRDIQKTLEAAVDQRVYHRAQEFNTKIQIESPRGLHTPGSFLEKIEEFLGKLEEKRISGGCGGCRGGKKTSFFSLEGKPVALCGDCQERIQMEQARLLSQHSPSRYLLGTLGSFVGTLTALAFNLILSPLGFPYFLGLVLYPVFALIGYLSFKGPEIQPALALILAPPLIVFFLSSVYLLPLLRFLGLDIDLNTEIGITQFLPSLGTAFVIILRFIVKWPLKKPDYGLYPLT